VLLDALTLFVIIEIIYLLLLGLRPTPANRVDNQIKAGLNIVDKAKPMSVVTENGHRASLDLEI
jgi:hypothetical protein